eukprot:gene16465-biopygen4635
MRASTSRTAKTSDAEEPPKATEKLKKLLKPGRTKRSPVCATAGSTCGGRADWRLAGGVTVRMSERDSVGAVRRARKLLWDLHLSNNINLSILGQEGQPVQ